MTAYKYLIVSVLFSAVSSFFPLKYSFPLLRYSATAIMGVLQDEPNDPNTPIPRFYPIGTPGQPWATKEDDEWKAQTKQQRSYQTQVVAKLKVLLMPDNHHPHLKLVQYGTMQCSSSVEYPLYVVQSKDWNDQKPSILVTGGVHGYETSGVQGAITFLETRASGYLNEVNLLVFPCVSPWAYEHIQRWQHELQDPNRSFLPEKATPESQALMDYLHNPKHFSSSATTSSEGDSSASISSIVSWTCHLDLHETTDTDETEFMPAKHAKAGLAYAGETIPDGFYLVGDDQNPQLDFQTAVIESVKTVTHIAPPDERGEIIEVPLARDGLILVPAKQLGLCCSVTGGTYVTTTEVYPDSPLVTDEICNQAQVAAITGAIDYVLKQNEEKKAAATTK
jgi:hypothetical protein